MTFDTLGLDGKLLKAIKALGFEHPTPIQEKVISAILDGQTDLVGLAQTGTGKTAAFGLPMLQLINFSKPSPQALIICPTRELCLQITGDLIGYARYIKKANIVAVYGGANIGTQIKQLKRGAHIVVATPGRLLDLIKRKAVTCQSIQYCVLDEADEMLSMGFQEDINSILEQTPDDKRIWLFSATMPSAAARMAKSYMHAPLEISIGRVNTSADNIEHSYYVIREKERYAALKRLIDYAPDIYGLIFCRTRQETRTVAEKLMKEGYSAEALHGDLSQEQRNYVMHKFREKNLQILVATDVAARGLDVDDITHVIQYNLPDEAERYTHRSGRTARAGKSGISMLLVNTREAQRVSGIERRIGTKFNRGKIPMGSEICEKQLYAMVERMVNVDVNHDQIEPYLSPVYKALGHLNQHELIQRFVSVEFNRFLDYYRDTGDLNAVSRSRKSAAPKGRAKRMRDKGAESLFINVGRKHNIREGAIVRLICDKADIRSQKIGKIIIKNDASFFDIDKRVVQKVISSLKGAKLDGHSIEIRIAGKPKFRARKRKLRRKK